MKLIVIAGTGTGSTEQAAYLAAFSHAERSGYDVTRTAERATGSEDSPRESPVHYSSSGHRSVCRQCEWRQPGGVVDGTGVVPLATSADSEQVAVF